MKTQYLSEEFVRRIAFIDYELTGDCGTEYEWFLRGERKMIMDMIQYFKMDEADILRKAHRLQMTKVG